MADSSKPIDEMQSRSVRIFVSSTFRDFLEERDLLAKIVFPELRRRARQRSVDVVGVDLRWGITEAQSRRGETLPICLREIDRSRPFFIGLLGDRYGWIPSPDRFPAGLVRSQPWLREHLGGISITELEIRHGVLNHREGGEGMFYFRRPNTRGTRGQARSTEPAIASSRLRALKTSIRAGGYRVRDYATPQQLAEILVDDIWRRIDQAFPAESAPDPDSIGDRMQRAFAEDRQRVFVGREVETSTLTRRIDDALREGSALLAIGPSGCGKSALIANLSRTLKVTRPRWRVFEHYMGAGGESGSPRVEALVQRLQRWIVREYGVQWTIPPESESHRDALRAFLDHAGRSATASGHPAILLIDALDKCTDAALRNWLPTRMPSGVALVGTTTPGTPAEQLITDGARRYTLPKMTIRSARKLVVAELARRSRSLDNVAINAIVRHPQSGSPAFITALIEELCLFGKHDRLHARLRSLLRSKRAGGIYGQGLRRVENDHGKEAVRRTLSALCLSSEGLTESQLLSFTGVSQVAWSGIRLSAGDWLYEFDGRMRPTHELFRRAVTRRFTRTAHAQQRLHRRLAKWLIGQEMSPIDAYELLFHAYWSRSPIIAREVLMRPRTGIAVVEHVAEPNFIRLAQSASGSGHASPAAWLERTLPAAWRRWGTERCRNHVPSPEARWSAGIEILDILEHAGASSPAVVDLAARVAHVAESLGKTPGPWPKRDLAISLQRLGIVSLRNGKTDLAIRSLRRSYGLAKRGARGCLDGIMLGDLASSLEVLADGLQQAGDSGGARRALRDSLDIARHRQRLDASSAGAHDLCVALVRNAISAMEGGDLDRAEQLLDEAIDLVRSARHIHGERNLRGAYASALFNRARLVLQRGKPSDALPLLDEMIDASCRELEDVSHAEDRAQLAAGLGAKAEALLGCGDLEGARAAAKLAIGLERDLLIRGRSIDALREYCVTLGTLADIEQKSRRPLAAFAAINAAIEVLERADQDGQLTTELTNWLREDRHRAVDIATGRPWRAKASRHLEALLNGARTVARGDQSSARAAFLLRYLMLGIDLRECKSPRSQIERAEISTMARTVLRTWDAGAAERRKSGLTPADRRLARKALQLAPAR